MRVVEFLLEEALRVVACYLQRKTSSENEQLLKEKGCEREGMREGEGRERERRPGVASLDVCHHAKILRGINPVQRGVSPLYRVSLSLLDHPCDKKTKKRFFFFFVLESKLTPIYIILLHCD